MRYVLACALLVSCGKQGARRDCDSYAEAFADALRPDPSRRSTVISAEKHACDVGQVTDQQIACVNRASDEKDIRACMGQTSAPAASAGPISIEGVEGGGWEKKNRQAKYQQMWLHSIASLLSVCDPRASATPSSFDVVAIYGADEQIDVSAVPEAVRECVSRAFRRKKPTPEVADMNAPIRFHLRMQ